MRILHYYRVMTKPSGVTSAIGKWQGALLSAGVESVVLHNAPAACWELPSRHVRHVGHGRHGQVPLLAGHLLPGDVLVIHEGWTSATIAAAVAAEHRGIPYAVMPHGVYQPQIIAELKRPLLPRFVAERHYLRKASAVHTFFEPENRLVNGFAGKKLRYITVPTGMEVTQRAWTAGGRYLAWYGRYSLHHKGIDRMLRAYSLVPPARRLPLLLHGTDYHGGQAEVLRLVHELGLDDDVSVAGPVAGREKLDFLYNSAGFVFPSRWESHSIALLEALSLGVPVLAGDSLHISQKLKDAGAALVTDFDDPALSAAGMADLPYHTATGLQGREYVRSEFNWAHLTREYLAGLATAVASMSPAREMTP
jgi:glycosyltransferase involved in cell wall biosynthesis